MAVGKELAQSASLAHSHFCMMDIDQTRLDASMKRIKDFADSIDSKLHITGTTDLPAALENASYVVTSCEPQRVPLWLSDLKIPAKYGVHQYTGENGGPAGQAHAMRNITMFMNICDHMRQHCPDAWLMNFTNPMSYLCTYFHRYGNVKNLGFCHQVHGSFGVIAEMLGMQPGDLQVITGGVNHFNWLFDVRKKGTSQSYLDTFLEAVCSNEYWQGVRKNVPPNHLTREMLDVFGCYPVGYDDHIAEYIPFFYDTDERKKIGYEDHVEHLEQWQQRVKKSGSGFEGQVKAASESHVPFPRDPNGSYYKEETCQMIEALHTNSPTYTDAINIVNHGSIDNLPDNAIVDIPAVAVGGQVRGIHVGTLPIAAAELCRRQITLHEMVVQATVHGDRSLALQAMCLDPYIHGLKQARCILDDYLEAYRQYLPQFWK